MFKRVSDSVCFAQNDFGSNISCIALEDGLVFVDAGMLTSFTGEFRHGMERLFSKKASKLVLTHAHIDHFMGMDAFSDCELIAAEAAKPRFDMFLSVVFDEARLSRMENVFPYIRRAVAEGTLRAPTHWIESEEMLGDGLRFSVRGGHSACSSGILYEPEEVLFAGDLVQANGYPYFGEPDTDISRWIDTLDLWAGSDIQWVVPGHGPVVEPDYLLGVSGFFKALVDVFGDLKRDGVPVDEAIVRQSIPVGYWGADAVRTPAYDNSLRRLYDSL